MEPVLKAMSGNGSGKVHGIRIIVGQERSPGDNEALAKVIGEAATVDHDGSWRKKLQVSYYPTFLHVNSTGSSLRKIRERSCGQR